MTKKRIANQHRACFQGVRRGFCEVRATSSHPLSEHMAVDLHMVQISISI